MILFGKCSRGPFLIFFRNIYVHPALENNHYKVLGLSPSATQAEIKSAFYELSKKHHPDKNRGCEKSAQKFKDITAAYEVLRNEKLRQKYDYEQMSIRTTEYRQAERHASDYDDEDERNFYERTSKYKSKIYYGKTKQFDFDAWHRGHYGPNSFSANDFVYRRNPKPNIKNQFKSKISHQYQYEYQYQYPSPKYAMVHRRRILIKFIMYFLTGGSVVFFLTSKYT